MKSTDGTDEFSCAMCMLSISILLWAYGTCTGSRESTMCSMKEDIVFSVSITDGYPVSLAWTLSKISLPMVFSEKQISNHELHSTLDSMQ